MGPSRATWASRSRIAWGGSKSGKPWDRFTAPYFRETRVIRRITESVKLAVRSERGWGMVKITPYFGTVGKKSCQSAIFLSV